MPPAKKTKKKAEEETQNKPAAKKPVTVMRRFVLVRDVDPQGMSGEGVVAEGIQWTDGTCHVKFRSTDLRTETRFENIASVENLHSHWGEDPTRVVWVDAKPGEEEDGA